MSIQAEVTVTLATVEVTDQYQVGITVTDPVTMQQATIGLTLEQADQLADEIQSAASEAMSAFWEDRGNRVISMRHGFDTDGPAAS